MQISLCELDITLSSDITPPGDFGHCFFKPNNSSNLDTRLGEEGVVSIFPFNLINFSSARMIVEIVVGESSLSAFRKVDGLISILLIVEKSCIRYDKIGGRFGRKRWKI